MDPDNNPATDDGADVISMSLGYLGCSVGDPMDTAIKDAINKSIAVVSGSGNNGQGTVTCPGSFSEVITVGATYKSKAYGFPFSGGAVINGTIKPDIVAPGVDIISSVPGIKGWYGLKSGTSQSTPFVSGAVALMLQKDPSLTPTQAKQILTTTAEDELR